METGKLKKLRADDWMVDIGDPILYMPLLLKGQLRILREDEEGHELLLNYIRPGETCAMSLTCCSGNAVSNVRAVAEEDTELNSSREVISRLLKQMERKGKIQMGRNKITLL